MNNPNFIRKLSVLILFLVFLVFNACTPALSKIQVDELNDQISMEKGACRGLCPIYKLTLYDNGVMAYYGEQNTKKQGLHLKQLSEKQHEEILGSFREANLWQFQDAYRNNGNGFDNGQNQTVSLRFSDDGRTKTIIGKSGRPAPLLKLEAMLERYAQSDGWTARDNGQGKQNSEIVVHIREGVDAKNWAKKFARNKMEVLDNYGRDGEFWLVKFDPETTTVDKLLQKIRRDQDVVGAEVND